MSLIEPRRPGVVEPRALPGVDGEVTRVVEIHPYPNATAPVGGCTSFRGVYVTDPDEIAAIRRRVRRGGDPMVSAEIALSVVRSPAKPR